MSQQNGSLPISPDPDYSFEPSHSVLTGWSQPIFIIKANEDQYFLTKVVWCYDKNVADTLPQGDPRKDSFDKVKAMFAGKPILQAVNVTDQDLTGITHGMATK
jgi:hypothetical protein